jgi:NADPH-dependent glutamate synthase beta subunit-like oxidoreductase
VSIGYKGVAIEGSEPWFDESRGVMKNQHGLVDAANSDMNMGGLYVSGWLKRGPSGIIGTNIGDVIPFGRFLFDKMLCISQK